MRKLVLAATLVAIAAPAAAQPRHDPRYEPRPGEIERALPRGYEVERMGEMIARMTDALMDLDIRPVADAVDPYRRYDRRRGPETLGDLAGRHDPYARERIHDEVAATTAGLAAAADRAAFVAPVFRRSIEDAVRRTEAAMRESRYRRDRDYERRDDYRYDDDRR